MVMRVQRSVRSDTKPRADDDSHRDSSGSTQLDEGCDISDNHADDATAFNVDSNGFPQSDSPSGSRSGSRRGVSIVSDTKGTASAHEIKTMRARLQVATLVILFGFGVYLIRSYFEIHPLQGFHTLVVVVLITAIAVLVSRLDLTMTQLHLLELCVFGLPVLFLVPYQYLCLLQQQSMDDAVGIVAADKTIASYWFCLIIIYGLFIPNRWQRTATIVVPMVFLPVAVGIVASVVHPNIREHLTLRRICETYMILCVGSLCATYGAGALNSLRREIQRTKHFGQYRLLDRLDRGGMGEVYKAEHQLLKRPCAIKLIREDQAGDERALARFEREVRAMAGLTHWNTVDVYDYGRSKDGTLYYVMEYLPGMNLRQILLIEKFLTPARCIHLLTQICGALHEAHSSSLIHRDINSGNIFVTERGGVFDVAKLLDFGLVKTVENEEDTCLTQIGSISGTPKYMPPEQAKSAHCADARSDIYSLGAVAYEMLAGQLPFAADSPIQFMIAHARDPVRSISEWNREVPPELDKIVLKCMEKDPSLRFQDARSLKEALETCSVNDKWNQQSASLWWQQHSAELTN